MAHEAEVTNLLANLLVLEEGDYTLAKEYGDEQREYYRCCRAERDILDYAHTWPVGGVVEMLKKFVNHSSLLFYGGLSVAVCLGEGVAYLLAVVEVVLLGADNLIILVALACDKDYILGLCQHRSGAYRLATVGYA